MTTLTPIKVYIDMECNAEKWWDALREKVEQGDCWEANLLKPLLAFDVDEIEIEHSEYMPVFQFCESLPGWNYDCENAQYPLIEHVSIGGPCKHVVARADGSAGVLSCLEGDVIDDLPNCVPVWGTDREAWVFDSLQEAASLIKHMQTPVHIISTTCWKES